MVFNVYSASAGLRPFIKGYLVADSTKTEDKTIHKLFPNGYSGIFFNFGNLGKLNIKEEYETPRVSIFGQIDRSFEAIHWPGSYSLGVLLEPTVLSKFLRVNMSEFTNKAFDGTLMLMELHRLYEQLEETFLLTKKIELFNRFFTEAFSTLGQSNLIDRALQLMIHKNSLSVKSLATDLGVSDRYLETQFKEYVGLSPKAYSMILRFKRMEKLLHTNPKLKWGEINFTDEYYDQNHFIKDFRRFTGYTPTDYLERNSEMGRSYLVH